MAALAAIGPLMTAISAVTTIAGTGIAAYGQRQAAKAQADQQEAMGRAQQEAANFEAAQLEAKGKEEQAVARVEADEIKRRKDLALSTLQARGAASGFSATDATSMQIGDEISKYGTVQEQMVLYGGAGRRQNYNTAAAGERYTGASAYQAARTSAQAIRKGSKLEAMGTIIGGVSTLADRFATRLPASTGSSSYRYG